MNCDDITPFDTISEMIETIPWIVNCHEENAILEVFGNHIGWFNLGWNYGNDIYINNQILNAYFPNLKVVED